MKKTFKKIFILILSVIASLTPIMTAYAETPVDSFNAKHHEITPPISFGDKFHVIKTTSGKYIYCLQYNKLSPNEDIKYTKGTLITNNGLNYLLNKAYNVKNDSEYFIYKSAVWLYMADTGIMEGSHNTINDYYENVKKSNTTEAKQILQLIADAKKAGANDTTAPTINVNTTNSTFNLDSTKKYYVSNNITVTSSTGSYTATLTKAPAGSTIETNKNTITIKVPADKVDTLDTLVSFKVTNSKDVYTSYRYNPSNSLYQPTAATFKETKTATAIGEVTLKTTVSVPVLKVDAQTGEAISGAELKLSNSKGEVIRTWTSGAKAEVITGLTEGKYTLTEVEAPEGYIAIDKTIKFSIDSKGNILDANGNKIVKVIITNEKKTGGVEISKQDITNKEELPGATLVVKDKDGNIIDEWISTDKPHYIEKLVPGTYTLTETIAPAGYILSEETITFEVKGDGTIAKVVMYNEPLPSVEVPVEPTSSFKTLTSSIIGVIAIIAGSLVIFKNYKKKELN